MKKIIAEIKTTPDTVEKLTYIVRMFPKKIRFADLKNFGV